MFGICFPPAGETQTVDGRFLRVKFTFHIHLIIQSIILWHV